LELKDYQKMLQNAISGLVSLGGQSTNAVAYVINLPRRTLSPPTA